MHAREASFDASARSVGRLREGAQAAGPTIKLGDRGSAEVDDDHAPFGLVLGSDFGDSAVDRELETGLLGLTLAPSLIFALPNLLDDERR